MKKILSLAVLAGGLASPVFAQQASTCAGYLAEDDAGRLQVATQLQSAAGQMSSQTFTAGEIRTKVDDRCAADPAVILLSALEQVVE
jgi:hypothetical protein